MKAHSCLPCHISPPTLPHTPFLAQVAYILAVNPNILQTTGGTCSPATDCDLQSSELTGAACLSNVTDPLAVDCLANLQRNLITATAASSLISTFIIGALANLPLALAPGLGVNAYVAYQVIGVYGRGELTYQQTMATIFVESWIFILLSITGVRGGIIKFMPKTVALASSVGIGLLLAFTGLRNLDVVVFDPSTLVQLGGCGVDGCAELWGEGKGRRVRLAGGEGRGSGCHAARASAWTTQRQGEEGV